MKSTSHNRKQSTISPRHSSRPSPFAKCLSRPPLPPPKISLSPIHPLPVKHSSNSPFFRQNHQTDNKSTIILPSTTDFIDWYHNLKNLVQINFGIPILHFYYRQGKHSRDEVDGIFSEGNLPDLGIQYVESRQFDSVQWAAQEINGKVDEVGIMGDQLSFEAELKLLSAQNTQPHQQNLKNHPQSHTSSENFTEDQHNQQLNSSQSFEEELISLPMQSQKPQRSFTKEFISFSSFDQDPYSHQNEKCNDEKYRNQPQRLATFGQKNQTMRKSIQIGRNREKTDLFKNSLNCNGNQSVIKDSRNQNNQTSDSMQKTAFFSKDSQKWIRNHSKALSSYEGNRNEKGQVNEVDRDMMHKNGKVKLNLYLQNLPQETRQPKKKVLLNSSSVQSQQQNLRNTQNIRQYPKNPVAKSSPTPHFPSNNFHKDIKINNNNKNTTPFNKTSSKKSLLLGKIQAEKEKKHKAWGEFFESDKKYLEKYLKE